MKITAVIQARMGSTRLPGKVLLMAADKPLLQHQIERVNNSRLINEIVVATTTKEEDNAIVDLCKKLCIRYFRGSELDVLDRFYRCAVHFGLDIIVRLTADDPLQDPGVMDKVIKVFLENKCDYASNTIKTTYPDGLDVEVLTINALKLAWKMAKLSSEREHVTPFIKNHPEIFKQINVVDEIDNSSLYWALDNKEDYIFIKNIIENLGGIKPYFNYHHIIDYLNRNPGLSKINKESIRDIGYIKSLEEDKKATLKGGG